MSGHTMTFFGITAAAATAAAAVAAAVEESPQAVRFAHIWSCCQSVRRPCVRPRPLPAPATTRFWSSLRWASQWASACPGSAARTWAAGRQRPRPLSSHRPSTCRALLQSRPQILAALITGTVLTAPRARTMPATTAFCAPARRDQRCRPMARAVAGKRSRAPMETVAVASTRIAQRVPVGRWRARVRPASHPQTAVTVRSLQRL